MSDQNLFKVTAEREANAIINNAGYIEKYERSLADPVKFWEEEGKSCLLYTSPSPRD